MFKKFIKKLEERLQAIEKEIGIYDEPQKDSKRSGGLIIPWSIFGPHRHQPLHKKTAGALDQIGEIQKEIRELRDFLGLEYAQAHVSLVKKEPKKTKSNTWESKIVEAIDEAIDERL